MVLEEIIQKIYIFLRIKSLKVLGTNYTNLNLLLRLSWVKLAKIIQEESIYLFAFHREIMNAFLILIRKCFQE